MDKPSVRAEPVVAVVLGGGADALARELGVAAKALVPLRGQPMGAYVLDALAESGCVTRSIYVGPDEGLKAHLGTSLRVPAGARLTDSLALGLGAALALAPERLLLLSADLPWLNSSSVDAFIRDAPKADLVYPVIPRAATEAQFPAQKRTYARVREGEFTGGNLVLLKPGAVAALLPFMDRLYKGRKNPLALATIFGLDVVAKLATGRAAVGELERRASRLLGADVRAFISNDAALGADIDKPAHLASFDLPGRD